MQPPGGRLLLVFAAALSGCATTAPAPSPPDAVARTGPIAPRRVGDVLGEHGFAPPVGVERLDGVTWWVSERCTPAAAACIDRVVVRTPSTDAPTVELTRWARGPSDWAQLGALFVEPKLAAEAAEMERSLR